MVASTRGNAVTDALVDGKPMTFGLTYAKARKEILEPEQVAILKKLVKELERHG